MLHKTAKFKTYKKTLNLTAIAVTMSIASSMVMADAEFDNKWDQWLKASELGQYHGDDNWAEIIKKAKAEGEVVVYSSTASTQRVAADFMKLYPEIKVSSYKLGSTKSVEKAIREQDADIHAADIITTPGARSMIFEMLPDKRIVNYVPKYLEGSIPEEYKQPLLTRHVSALALIYNTDTYKTQPLKNIWELTEKQWEGRFATKNPVSSASTMTAIAAFVENADAMAAAYKSKYGKDIVLSKGIKNAGYEFLHRLIANDIVIFKSGSKLAAASGKKGQKKPLFVIAPMHYLSRNAKKGYANAVIADIEPASVYTYSSYMAIARFAPNPNAAKLFTAFSMGSDQLAADSKLEKPYREGDSLALLQGMADQYSVGGTSPRNDFPVSPDNSVWKASKHFTATPEFIRDNSALIGDFWTIETSK